MKPVIRTLVVVFLCSSLLNAYSEETKKIALVIGNSNYESLGKLKNPANDAKAMSSALESIGFKVYSLIDTDLNAFEQALVDFSNDLKQDKNSIGLFYYAGHGIQANGVNYFLPTQTNIVAES